jgi:hypothetical protein
MATFVEKVVGAGFKNSCALTYLLRANGGLASRGEFDLHSPVSVIGSGSALLCSLHTEARAQSAVTVDGYLRIHCGMESSMVSDTIFIVSPTVQRGYRQLDYTSATSLRKYGSINAEAAGARELEERRLLPKDPSLSCV